jgi:hypothetical protein
MSYSDVFQRPRIAAAFCRWQKRNSTACNRAMRTRLLSRLGTPPSEAVKVTVGSHSFGRCCHVLPLCREDVHANPFSRGERHKCRQPAVTPRRGWKIKGRGCAAHRNDGCVTTPPRRHARRLTARSSLRVKCPQRTCGCTGLATMLCQYGHARPLSPNSRAAWSRPVASTVQFDTSRLPASARFPHRPRFQTASPFGGAFMKRWPNSRAGLTRTRRARS